MKAVIGLAAEFVEELLVSCLSEGRDGIGDHSYWR